MNFKMILGLVMMIFAVGLGLYVGGWIMLVGGIIQVVQSVTPVVIAKGIAIGIARVMFAGLVGYLVAIVAFIPGLALFHLGDK